MTSEPPPPRTAAATAAWRRRGEERKAGELQARGWLVVPPEHAGAWSPAPAESTPELTARVRQVPGADGAGSWLEVRVCDRGGQLVAAFTTPGTIPPVQRLSALNQVSGALAEQGFTVTTGWTVGHDAGGRVAVAPARRVTNRVWP